MNITETTRPADRTFALEVNQDELLHLEAAVDAFPTTDAPETWLGVLRHRYDRSLVATLHGDLTEVRNGVVDDLSL